MRCRHHTDRAGLKGVMKDMAINPSRGDPIGVDVEVEPFGPVHPWLTQSPQANTGASGGGAYVEFDLPDNAIRQPWVGPRNNARIPTSKPLRIDGLRPVFVVPRWWQFWKLWRG
jgi:hypothetical protein